MTEILPNIHSIQTAFDNRLLNMFLLVGQEGALLIDSGVSNTPEEIILPYLDRLGISVEEIKWLVVTHASGDHFGGNHVLKSISPGIAIVAHKLDASSISNHSVFIKEHITDFRNDGIPCYEIDPTDQDFIAIHGLEVSVDWEVQGDEEIHLGNNWYATLLHTPGHTPGHLMVHDPAHRALFTGDGIMGNGVPDTKGNLNMPPSYFELDWYLETIEKVSQLSPHYILGTHYPLLFGDEALGFVEESRNFISVMCDVILAVLSSENGPISMPTIINRVRSEIRIPGSDYQYGMSIRAHLRDLVEKGVVLKLHNKVLIGWALSN